MAQRSFKLAPHRLLLGGLLFLLVLAAMRLFSMSGLFRPYRIVSGSMAERLLGEHFLVTCADCLYVCEFGVDSPPPNERITCPNCGYGRNVLQPEWRKSGDKAIVDRAAYWFESPRRFDLVAFRDPRFPARMLVKRLVGMPGERLAIRHGDVYVNDQLLRKSLGEFRRQAIFVHDNDFQPQRHVTLPARWRADDEESGWSVAARGFGFNVTARRAENANREKDWLTYHHWRGYASPYPREAEAPIADNSGYNQGESRELRSVSDIVLTAHMRFSREVSLRVHDGREWFTATLDANQRTARIKRGGRPFASGVWRESPADQDLEIEFGIIDRQVVLGIAREELIRTAYEPALQPFKPVSTPLAIGGESGSIAIRRLLIRRDVYYLDPWLVGQAWQMATAPDTGQFLVLGDNPPLSDDSRHWQDPFLKRSAILGRVVPLPR